MCGDTGCGWRGVEGVSVIENVIGLWRGKGREEL